MNKFLHSSNSIGSLMIEERQCRSEEV